MADKHEKISMEIDTGVKKTAVASLTTATAASIATSHSGTAAERTAVMSRIQMEATVKYGDTSDATGTAWEAGQLLMILGQGQADPADIAEALDESLNIDWSPAAGIDVPGAFIAKQGVVVLIVPFKLLADLHDEASAVHRPLYGASYLGPPLRQGGSWTFPEGSGWKWFVYNYGGDTTPSGSELNFFARQHVIWRRR